MLFWREMASARRNLRLCSNEFVDALMHDDDSDEEEASDNEIEESIQDPLLIENETPKNVIEPGHESDRSRIAPQRRIMRPCRGRGRSAASSSTRGSRTSHSHLTAKEIDEGNGWMYKSMQQLLVNPVFQEQCRVLAPLNENSSELDCFFVFFPDSFWKLIKVETNRYASQMKAKQARQGILKPGTMLYNWKPVTISELKTFFAIIIHMTLVHKESLDSYWSTRVVLQTSFAKKLMSRNRFRAIYSCLHLNDNSKYIPRGQPEYDAFFKLRPYFDELCRLCAQSFYPDEALTIDEGTCAFRGRVHFRVYNKDKPDKYGMKVYMLYDAATGYILQMVHCTGDAKTIETIVTELSRPYCGKWHTIYMKRFFTSPTIADLLWINDTRVVGTVMSNRPDLPQHWHQQILDKNEMSFCHRGNLTACKWHDKRDVYMLTTKHGATWTLVESKVKSVGITKRQKPDCILDYNHCKIGVDLNDQYVSYYSLNRKNMKWWKKMFFNLVTRAIVNAYVLYNISRTQQRRPRFSEFLMVCCEGLVTAGSADDPGPSSGPHATGKCTRLIGRHFVERIPSTGKKEKVARVCIVCADTVKKNTGKRGRKETIYFCPDCNVPLCYHPCFKKNHTKSDYTC